MSRGIRGYGPGKFNTIIDSYVYDLINSGWGKDSCGDVSEVGFYAESVDLGDEEAVEAVEKVALENKDTLTEEEKDLIRESAGAIMVENEQGFVSIDYYDNEKEMDSDWAEVEDDASPEDEEEDGEEEESEAEGAEEAGE